jgi:hypothetical protein
VIKKFEKFWSGSVSFTAHENFNDLDSAIGSNSPSDAAKIVIDESTISYDFNRIKEVKTDGDNSIPRSGKSDRGEREREKKSER